MSHRRLLFPIASTLLLVLGGGCASAPPSASAGAPAISADQKMGWILRLEDQRILRAAAPAPSLPPPVVAPSRRKGVTPPAPAPVIIAPDLTVLLTDSDARIRQRAALAIGRVGLTDGVAPLQTTLADPDPEVRAMAAFGLGLLGQASAVAALTPALQDADPRVRARAAEALGLIGDTRAAAAVGQMAGSYLKAGALAGFGPDDDQWPKAPEADAVRVGLFALVRMKAWDPLAAVVLDGSGQPVSDWWPVAYALQRINDRRALPALQRLGKSPGHYTRAFAARGMGALKDAASVPLLLSMLEQAKGDVPVSYSVMIALGQIGAPEGVAPILAMLKADKIDPNLRLEAVNALAALKSREALPVIQDLLIDDWPTMRAAAVHAQAVIDPQGFLTVLSGLEPDAHWSVRAAIAEALGTMPAADATDRLRAMLTDQDKRVIPAVLDGLTKLKAPAIDQELLTQLKNPDVGIRTAAARALGQLKPAGGPAALRDAYNAAQTEGSDDAREAALVSLAGYGATEALATLKSALADHDWALRLKAAALLHTLDATVETTQAIRPAPGSPSAAYDAPILVAPTVSPHVFVETAKGTIEIELTVLDAPQTCQNFMALVRRGYFNGLQIHRVVPNFVVQDGDPRGDGSGGPGYTIRDELNGRPYVRGTVGMALSGPDTGGSQFFITHSPQPHLDAKYTVFGRVVNGMDVVDRLQQLDVIQRMRVWDGKQFQ